MKFKVLLFAWILFYPLILIGQTYFTDKGFISFFSSAPLEDIKAENFRVSSLINLKTGRMVFRVPIRAFEFDKSLMRTHFNEEFMETDKFPSGEFEGNIKNIENMDLTVKGLHNVTVVGKLTIKGITQDVEIEGTLEVLDEKIIGNSVFTVILEDYDIKRPSVLRRNIAEEVEVTVKMEYVPYGGK